MTMAHTLDELEAVLVELLDRVSQLEGRAEAAHYAFAAALSAMNTNRRPEVEFTRELLRRQTVRSEIVVDGEDRGAELRRMAYVTTLRGLADFDGPAGPRLTIVEGGKTD
jgi:hypothetical protein